MKKTSDLFSEKETKKLKKSLDGLEEFIKIEKDSKPVPIKLNVIEKEIVPLLSKKAKEKLNKIAVKQPDILSVYENKLYRCSYFGWTYNKETKKQSYKHFAKVLSKVILKYTVIGRLAPVMELPLINNTEKGDINRRILLFYGSIKEFPKGACSKDLYCWKKDLGVKHQIKLEGV